MASHVAYLLGGGFDARPKHRVCTILKVQVRGMPWPHTGATKYHAQLGLPDKVRTIEGLIVCNI